MQKAPRPTIADLAGEFGGADEKEQMGPLRSALRAFASVETMNNETAKQWIAKIHTDVRNLTISNQFHSQFRDIVNQNDKLRDSPNQFLFWISAIFADSMALGVRRQTDTGKEATSLWKLLERLKDQPNVVSPTLTTDEVNTDLADFRRKAMTIQNYADKRVAHFDKRGLQDSHPTFNDVSTCLNCMVKLVNKYSQLIAGAALTQLPPTESHTWKDIFRCPWIDNP